SLGEVEIVAGQRDDDRKTAIGEGSVERGGRVHQLIRLPSAASKRWMAESSGAMVMVSPGRALTRSRKTPMMVWPARVMVTWVSEPMGSTRVTTAGRPLGSRLRCSGRMPYL